jgi:hypothetical protein
MANTSAIFKGAYTKLLTSLGLGLEAGQKIKYTTGAAAGAIPVSDAQGVLSLGTLSGASVNTGLTQGSVPFIGASGVLSDDNANLFYDNTNDRLGIGTATPTARLQVGIGGATEVGSIVKAAAAQTANLTEWQNSSATVLASVSAVGDIACAKLSSRAIGDSTLRTSLNTFTATANRNNAGITAGHAFIPAAVLTVSQLGRYYAVGNTQDHQIGIWERETGTLVTSGTILAATASDGNGMKYVAVTPVNLDPSKEYIIAALESNGGDLWPDSHSTTGFFNNYVKRVGAAYFVGASFTLPNTFLAGLTVFNALDFKFTANASIQIKAEYDANSYLGIMARSTFGSTLMLSNNDTAICVASAFSVGLSAPPAGLLFSVSGNSRFSGNLPIETTNAGSAASGKFVVGATNVIGINGISVRSNYVIMDSGAGGDIIFNYDNTSRNVGISAIFSSIKFGVSNTVASNIVSVFRGAAAQTGDLAQWQDSTAAVVARVCALGCAAFTGLHLGIRSISSAPTITAADYTLVCDATAAGFTVTLPAAATNTGRIFNIKKVDSSVNAVTIDGNGAETIDGAATLAITTQWTSIKVQCTGTAWIVI